MNSNTFAEHCRELARRFLQTAIVVDDEALMLATDVESVGEVVEPTRRPLRTSRDEAPPGSSDGHSLDSKALIDSFAELGVICGVIGPTKEAMHTSRQADIVVLDWRLKAEEPEYALELLKDIVTGGVDRNALRLVAFYTGEADLPKIQGDVLVALKEEGLDPQDDGLGALTYGHGRIVLYAKPSVNLAGGLRGRQFAEDELPSRLVGDFSRMTAGLLPSIALVSLTAVRESAHMVLDRFCSRLDPAFLAHRACLPNPDDAEQQMVNHVAEELRGLIDYAVAGQSPAGESAVAAWVRDRSGDPPHEFRFGAKSLTTDETVALAEYGLAKSRLAQGDFKYLSEGFAGHDVQNIDEELAWIISSRTVFDAPPPTLWLGTVVVRRTSGNQNNEDADLICLRPKCDSIRLKGRTSFAFLPLVEPQQGQEQLIVKSESGYRRHGIAFDPSGWEVHDFEPSGGRGVVLARKVDSSEAFVFKDADDNEYDWLGELKAEFVQRIARAFADNMSRPAVEESEWLRRSAQR